MDGFDFEELFKSRSIGVVLVFRIFEEKETEALVVCKYWAKKAYCFGLDKKW